MYTDGWSQLCFPAARWSVVPEWRQILFSDTGLRWQEWRDSGRLHLVKDAPHRKVFRVELGLQILPQHTANPDFGLAGKKTVYVKLYPLTGFRQLAETLGVSNKAREECEKLLSLLRQGIPTVEPIACGQDQQHAFVVTVGLEDVVPLDHWLIEIFPNLSTCEQKRLTFVLPDVVARIIAALHRAGRLPCRPARREFAHRLPTRRGTENLRNRRMGNSAKSSRLVVPFPSEYSAVR
jgi:hypothetical protein